MKTLDNTKNVNISASAVALGNFDGLHIGHIKLIDEILYHSKRENIPSVVWSFRQHPENMIRGDITVKRITTLDEKAELLSSKGVDYLVLEDFNAVRDLSPDEFIKNILIDSLHARLVVVGFNFRFGKNAAGTSEYLSRELKKYGVTVKIIPPVIYGDTLVSSSVIRALIENGSMEQAALLLGRPFFISFPVIHGRAFGRTIGIPTINQLFPDNHIVPERGVYATACHIDGLPYLGVCNVGVRPTVSNAETVTCETHIIDFVGSLYGQNIRVEFYKKLRSETKFSSVDKLQDQIKRDIEETKSYYNLHF